MSKPANPVPKRNIASLINGMFVSMRMSGVMAKREVQTDNTGKSSRQIRKTTLHPAKTGTRQAARIAKQIAKGQLKKENGLG